MSSVCSTRETAGARRVPSAADGLFQSPLNVLQVVFCFVRNGGGAVLNKSPSLSCGCGLWLADDASKLKQFIHVLPTRIAGEDNDVALDAELFDGA